MLGLQHWYGKGFGRCGGGLGSWVARGRFLGRLVLELRSIGIAGSSFDKGYILVVQCRIEHAEICMCCNPLCLLVPISVWRFPCWKFLVHRFIEQGQI